MGAHWLLDLPDWLHDAGLDYRVWDGWEQRSRSSGGYDQTWAVIVHHTASTTNPDNDCSYMWDSTSGDQPIGAMLLDRTGRVTIGAAGATNCAGKGGPVTTSHGTIAADKGNTYAINIEAANAGTGERWPTEQLDAYTVLVGVLCDQLDLDPYRDVFSHFEWAPDRKIDPAGPDRYATGAASWDMDEFRADLGDQPPPDQGDDDMPTAQEVAEAVWSHGMTQYYDNTVKQAAAVMSGAHAEAARAKEAVDQLRADLQAAGVLE